MSIEGGAGIGAVGVRWCVSVRGENVDSSCKKSENEGGSVTMETIVNLS